MLNFEKLVNYQTKHLVHFATALKLQENLAQFLYPLKTSENLWFRNHFVSVKKTSKTEEYAILNQIPVGTNNQRIRKKTLLKNWNLQGFYQNEIKYESAAAGSYSYRSIKKRNNP